MTSKLLLTVLCCAIAASALAAPETRIAGGQGVVPGDLSSFDSRAVVSVRIDHTHECGGTVIGYRHILTAAHCVIDSLNKPYNETRVTVRYGSTNQYAGGTIATVQRIKIHEEYGNFLSDLAIVYLDHMLAYNSKVQRLGLPSGAPLPVGAELQTVGWGRFNQTSPYPYNLHHGVSKIISPSQCEEEIGFGSDQVLCLGHEVGQGICNGDAGGPAMLNKVVYGIGSFTVGTCGSRFPDGFTSVTHHLQWIRENIKRTATV